jgi:Kef-type K+ transport system membrane component KefB
MKLPLVGIELDERFLTHRLRSTSLAGIVGGVLSVLLFLWHLIVDHQYNWELFAIGATFAAVKLAAMLWYRLTD